LRSPAESGIRILLPRCGISHHFFLASSHKCMHEYMKKC